MVVYVLYIKATLQGVERLSLNPQADLCLSVRNPVDAEQVREKIVIDSSALEDPPATSKHHVQHAEAPCHFSLKWSSDEPTRSTIRLLNKEEDEKLLKKVPTLRDMTAADSGTFVPVLALECQGVEPFAFHCLGEEFTVETGETSSKTTTDLSNGSWHQYDLATGSTSVLDLQCQFE